MYVDKHIVETQYSCPLKCTVNRYRRDTDERPGFILVFAHGTGFHKEHWEVTIQRIFVPGYARLEAMEDPDFKYSVRDYAEACANVYKTHLANRIQQGKYRVVLVGHSAGGSSAALATSFLDDVPFAALVLIEPTIWPEELTGPEHESPIVTLATQTIPLRRDHWKSREDARTYLAKRIPWSMWDRRILDIYVEYGLLLDPSNGGVKLKCPPRHEAYPFANIHEAAFPITELERVKGRLAVHLVYGEREEMMKPSLKVGTIASVTQIPDAGHLVVQEAPDLLGGAIWNIIRGIECPAKL
ncbi:Alpha/Beta hydrolase protein [Armillaria mellea]|nr:Alpha/Beta hydrolase protein [Armillaria mellea]